MRKFVVFGTLLACVAAAVWAQGRGEDKTETLLRWQFAGTRQMADVKDLKTFREIMALPETAALRDAAAEHFAAQAARRFGQGGGTNANPEIMRAIQPLLADLWINESSFQMIARGPDLDWMLALKLEASRSEEWSKALSQLAKAAGLQAAAEAKRGTGANWTAQKDNYRLSFSRAKDWIVIEGGSGKADPKSARSFRSDLGKRRAKQLLIAEVNSPLLAKVWNLEKWAHSPKFSVRAEPKGDGLRSELVMDYPEDLGIKSEKWNVPANLINEPLIGFTAIQGVQKKLGTMEKFKTLGAEQTPNQLFFWSQANVPFGVFVAAEVKNPAQVVTNAFRAFSEVKLPTGHLRLSTNRPVVFWEDVGVRPFLEAARPPHSSFLQAGLFPVQMWTNKPAPPELFAQLKKKNVIYYEWEITGERMNKLVPIWQLYYIIGRMAPRNDAASEKWIHSIADRLGNTATEGTIENPRRLKLVRQSQLGFNSLELILLAHLVDDHDIVVPRRGDKPRPNLPPPALR